MLVNNAGYGLVGAVEEADADDVGIAPIRRGIAYQTRRCHSALPCPEPDNALQEPHMRLGVTATLYRTLRSTNALENLNGLVGHFVRHVRRWRNGRMLVRWIATGQHEVGRNFRRLRGHRDLAALTRALDRTAMESRKEVGAVTRAADHRRSTANGHPPRGDAKDNALQ